MLHATRLPSDFAETQAFDDSGLEVKAWIRESQSLVILPTRSRDPAVASVECLGHPVSPYEGQDNRSPHQFTLISGAQKRAALDAGTAACFHIRRHWPDAASPMVRPLCASRDSQPQQLDTFMKQIKHILYICLIVALSLTAFAASPPDDAKAVQGSWTPARAELAGQPMADAVLKSISLKLDNGKYEVLVGGNPDKGTYTIDPTSKPRSMTITGTDGPNNGKTFPAIYELKGDTLRICYDLSGAKRPTEFKSVAGTKLYLVTYNRTKE
jgi:uncharacterized protein (TIGR03067 family)